MRLTGIHVYPIKGARGTSLSEAAVEARGLRHDRRFMIVDRDGIAITQRQNARLALVAPSIERDALVVGGVRVPLSPEGPRREVVVWHSTVSAVEASADASAAISDVIGEHAALVFMPDDAGRRVKEVYARDVLVSFADAFPFLLASEASLADLNRQLEAPVPMDRFRPNFVIDGDRAWAEDEWAAIRIGELEFRMPKGCDRCVVTTIDQRTATAGREPLATLARIRHRDNKVWFGENLIHAETGTVRVGDTVTVAQRR